MQTCRISVVGFQGSGKSALVRKCMSESFVEDYVETNDENTFCKILVVDGVSWALDILDTPGPDSLEPMPDARVRNFEGYLFVYSVTSLISFDYLHIIHDQIARIKCDASFPLVLVGTKNDLVPDEMPREVNAQQAIGASRIIGCPFFETSSRLEDSKHIFKRLIRLVSASRSKCNTPSPGAAQQQCTVL